MIGNGSDIEYTHNVYVENDIEVDDNGTCDLLTFLYVNDEEEPLEVRNDLEDVVEDLVEHHREFGVQSYHSLYAIAHELSRNAEIIRTAAAQMEDSVAAAEDLFDTAVPDVD